MKKKVRYIIKLHDGEMAYKDAEVSERFNPVGPFCPFTIKGSDLSTIPECIVEKSTPSHGKKIEVIWLISSIASLKELNDLDTETWKIHTKKDEESLIGGD